MANKKVSDLTAITSTEGDDLIYIVDTSDTSGGSAGTSKKIKVQDLRTFSIKNCSFVSTNAEMALTIASSTNDSTTFSYTNIFIIPEKCRLVSIQSASASYDDLKPLMDQSLDMGHFYRQRLIDYLCDNSTLFPEYTSNTGSDLSPTTNNYTQGLNIDDYYEDLERKAFLSAISNNNLC